MCGQRDRGRTGTLTQCLSPGRSLSRTQRQRLSGCPRLRGIEKVNYSVAQFAQDDDDDYSRIGRVGYFTDENHMWLLSNTPSIVNGET